MSITLNWLHVISLLGAVQGLFLVAVLVTKRTNRTANRLLATVTVTFSVYLVSAVYYAAGWLSLVSLYGPEDVDLKVYGMDLLASKTYAVVKRVSVSPYAGASAVLSSSHEKATAVNLKDEDTLGVMGTVGAVAQVSVTRLAVEYNVAKVSSLSFKVGVGF